jgi:hypothetical protein
MAEPRRDDSRRDENPEREGIESDQTRGDDEAVTGRSGEERGESQDVDPDSADAEVDRDDTIDEI